MAEFSKNLWSPWRYEYIRGLYENSHDEGCFFCRNWQNPADDRKNHVLWRTAHCLAVLNKFPYTSGHLLVAPAAHEGDLQKLPPPVLANVMSLLRDGQKLLSEVLHAEGFNMGMNVGRCAGAGIPDHLHAHLVPRWTGDTNFIPVISDIRIIPQMLDDLYAQLAAAAPRIGLPPLCGDGQ